LHNTFKLQLITLLHNKDIKMFPNATDKYAEPSSHMDIKYNFVTEYYDPQAAIIRRYQLRYYPNDKTVEMVCMKTHKKFLHRVKFEHLSESDLFLGNKIHVYSRQLEITDFADAYTQRQLGRKSERTFGIIKPDAVSKLGEILTFIHQNDFVMTRARMVHLTEEQAGIFYREHREKGFFMDLVNYMSSGPIFVMELIGCNAVCKWRKMIGPTDVDEAKKSSPDSLRARYGTNVTKNSFHGADSLETATREMSFFFPDKEPANPDRKIENTAKLNNSTLCIIKPHMVKKGVAGEIIRRIEHGGFKITGVAIQEVDKANAEEFYEVYKGVVGEYQGMCEQLCEGPCVSLEISGDEPNTVERFRQFCGPSDPEIARHIRPASLRAIYGEDKVKNAIHCTDLEEDGLIEIEYFLRILNYLPF